MSKPMQGTKPARRRLWGAGTTLTALTAIATAAFSLHTGIAEAAPAATIAVSVATVVKSDVATAGSASAAAAS